VPAEPNVLPFALDVELYDGQESSSISFLAQEGACAARLGADGIRRMVSAMINGLEATYGAPPVLYGNDYLLDKVLGQEFTQRQTLWRVRAGIRFAPKPPWALWQFTNNESVDGISGPVDVNVLSDLGAFSARWETGDLPPGSIIITVGEWQTLASSAGRQTGGSKGYGTWGFLQPVAAEFVAHSDFPGREAFKGLAPGSPEFDAAWRKAGSQDPELFREAQRSFAQQHHYDPAVKILKSKCGLDVATRSYTLQEVVWALAVRTGPTVPPIVQACKELQNQDNWEHTDSGYDEAIIRQSFSGLISRHLASRSELATAPPPASK
jgi:hypothetical protein